MIFHFVIVFKNGTFDAWGKKKENPRHVMIHYCQLEMLPPQVNQSSIKSFLQELDSIQLSETMKTHTIFVSLFSLYTFCYTLHKWQGCNYSIKNRIPPKAGLIPNIFIICLIVILETGFLPKPDLSQNFS